MMKMPERIKGVPPYLFAEMDRIIDETRKKGLKIINIAIGNPDLPPPQPVINTIKQAVEDKTAHLYPPYWGTIELREKIAAWMQKRFGATFDPEDEIMILIGAKEGVAHLFFGLCDRGDNILIPNPGYPVYRTAAIFSESDPTYMPLREENDFLPDIDKFDKDQLKNTKAMIINYPNNPTSKQADLSFFEKLIGFCRKWQISLIHDNAYSEIYGREKPPSVFQVTGSKELAIEFHSFSKTYSMQGYRIGWACGNKDLVRALSIIKTNSDSGVFVPIQKAAIKALDIYDQFVPKLREVYSHRRKIVQRHLDKLGWEYLPSDATIYVWVKMGTGEKKSMKFVVDLIRNTGVMVSPGVGYGEHGEGYIRISLAQSDELIEEGMQKLTDFVKTR